MWHIALLLLSFSPQLTAMDTGKQPVYDDELAAQVDTTDEAMRSSRITDLVCYNSANEPATPSAMPSDAPAHFEYRPHTNSLPSEETIKNIPLCMMAGFQDRVAHTCLIIEKLTKKIIKHGCSVNPVTLSSNGKYLATLSWDYAARVTCIATGKAVCTVRHNDLISLVVLSPDGNYLATGSFDNTARVTCIATDQTVCTVQHNGSVYSVAFSPDGNYLATGSYDGTARVTCIATGKAVCTVRHNHWITSVAFSPDGNYLATGSCDNTARITCIATDQTVCTIPHNNSVYSVAFSPDGNYLATGCDYTTGITNIKTGQTVCAIQYTGLIFSVAFSPDRNCLTINCGTSTAHVTHWAAVREFAQIATLNMCELLHAFHIAAQDSQKLPLNQRAIIHANEQQWKTWLQLKEILPACATARLEKYIVQNSEHICPRPRRTIKKRACPCCTPCTTNLGKRKRNN